MILQTHYWAYNLRRPEWKRQRHPNVHYSKIYNSQDMEATKMAINRWMDKQEVVHVANGILAMEKKETMLFSAP